MSSVEERIVSVLRSSIAVLQESCKDVTADTEVISSCRHPTNDQLADMAAIVVESMSRPGRVYHNLDHVFDVMADMKPDEDATPLLAAIFHDVVYLSIDKELSKQQKRIIGSTVMQIDSTTNMVSLSPLEQLGSLLDQMVKSIFSYQHSSADGSLLARPTRAVDETNEYLSAITAVHMLEPFVAAKHLFQIVSCIEASIPFRTMDDGSTAMDSLLFRLEATARRFSHMLGDMDRSELVKTVQMAAYFANHDLGAFRATDPQVFVNSSWRLLPEWCPRLVDLDCQLPDLLDALYLLQQRYQQMNVSNIFQTFDDDPSEAMLDEWKSLAVRNLDVVTGVTAARITALRLLKDRLASRQTIDKGSADSGTDKTSKIPLLLVQRVEEQFDHDGVCSSRSDSDAALITDNHLARQVYGCLLVDRPWVGSWDARQCRISASLVASVPWDVLCTASRRWEEGKHSFVDNKLPSDVLNELDKAIDTALIQWR